MSKSNFLHFEEVLLVSSCLFDSKALSKSSELSAWDFFESFFKKKLNHNLYAVCYGIKYYNQIVRKRSSKRNLIAANLFVDCLQMSIALSIEKGNKVISHSQTTEKYLKSESNSQTNYIPANNQLDTNTRESLIRNMGLTVSRGLNQIVDMNQTSKIALSFKFILSKLYFHEDILDFVSEMRHAIVHKEFPSSSNVKRLTMVVLNWAFNYFWKPLILINSKQFDEWKMGQLRKFFFKAVSLRGNQMLERFKSLKREGNDLLGNFGLNVNLEESSELENNYLKILRNANFYKERKLARIKPKVGLRKKDLFIWRDLELCLDLNMESLKE